MKIAPFAPAALLLASVVLMLSVAPAAVAVASTGGAWDEPINAFCPVMPDEAIDPSITMEWQGHTIAFCCRMCRGDFEADPAPFLDNLKDALAVAAATTPVAALAGAAQVDGHGGHAGEEHDEAFLPGWVGRSHVIVIHFPLALLVAAAVAELLARRRGETPPSPVATFCLAGGAVAACVAVLTGWTRAEAHPTPLTQELFNHRWLGVAVMSLSLLAWMLAGRARRTRRVGLYRACLYTCAVAALATGHFGGTLAWGKGFLFG